MARRKTHPADIANATILAEAVRFDLALFLGAGRYATDTAATLKEARAKASRLVAAHPNGRRPLIYGVTADGRSGLVSNADTGAKEDPMKTYAKKFNAQRAATAAGHRPDEVEIVKVGRGFAYRVRSSAPDARGSIAEKSNPPLSKAGASRKRAKKSDDPAANQLGKRAAIEAAARQGKLPEPPDFSAETHKRFRKKLEAVVELAKAGDLAGLRAFAINPISTSPKVTARGRAPCACRLWRGIQVLARDGVVSALCLDL